MEMIKLSISKFAVLCDAICKFVTRTEGVAFQNGSQMRQMLDCRVAAFTWQATAPHGLNSSPSGRTVGRTLPTLVTKLCN